MLRKVDYQGYLEIDHRESPGITPEEAKKHPRTLAVGAGQRGQFKTRTCCGCQARIVFLKESAIIDNWCRQCDKYMCDRCLVIYKVTGYHKPFAQIADEFMRRAANAT